MPIRPFQIAERELEPGYREIQVAGELDLAVAEQLKDALAQTEECDTVLICLADCDFIDSTGIAIVVRAYSRSANGGPTVAVHSAKGQVLRTLTVSGLASNGLLFDTREEALSLARS